MSSSISEVSSSVEGSGVDSSTPTSSVGVCSVGASSVGACSVSATSVGASSVSASCVGGGASSANTNCVFIKLKHNVKIRKKVKNAGRLILNIFQLLLCVDS